MVTISTLILDVSPYLRPRRWAAAIVTADAVLWNGASVSLAASLASEPDRDLLGRALVFRLVAEHCPARALRRRLCALS